VAAAPAQVIVVCGVQSAGKSTWARRAAGEQPARIIFDAALPGRRHLQPIIAAAHRQGAHISSIWIDTPLPTALLRNAARPADRIVLEAALRAVADRFEPPSTEEGFDTVLVVRP
jgi:predicted kinase